MTKPCQIVLADDHPLIRSGLRVWLEAEPDLAVAGEAEDGAQAQQLCRQLHPDVLVLDLNMPGPSSSTTVAYVGEHCPETAVLVLTAFDDDAYVRAMLAAGVAGYVLKDEAPDALVDAVRSVAHGGTWFSRAVVAALAHPSAEANLGLSGRERELLGVLVQGWDNTRIAAELGLGEQTVRNYLSRLYSKLGVQTREAAMVWAHARGIGR